MAPTVSETLRRVRDGHPIVTDPNSALLKGALGFIALALVVGVVAQVFVLRKDGARLRKIVPLNGSSACR
ncbi:hypothetical protein ACYSUW_17815 [Pseudomonas frederiksbergensis]|nr:hypothetical protein TMM008_26960 [Pseudomonas sp. 008]